MKKLKNLIKNLLVQEDKATHMLVNFSIVLILGILFVPVIGIAGALIASLLKETYDEFKEDGTGWDCCDLVADLIGIILGAIIIL